MFSFKITNARIGEDLAEVKGEDEVNLFYNKEYQQGDKIIFESSETDIFVWLQFDDALGRSLIYLKENSTEFAIPFGDKRRNLSPKAFSCDKHLISVKKAKDYEILQYRNLAFSKVDFADNNSFYPHVLANVETRGEAVFAAQNAIDGITANDYHGPWPYQSWGINQQADAKIKVDFGRKVSVDRINIYLRADFPHDSWWESGELIFSDGTSLIVDFIKSEKSQEFTFDKKEIEWVEFTNLIKANDESPFPALTQIEVFGTELN